MITTTEHCNYKRKKNRTAASVLCNERKDTKAYTREATVASTGGREAERDRNRMPLSFNHNKSESKRNRNYLMANMNKSSGDLLRTMQLVILIFISTVSTLLIISFSLVNAHVGREMEWWWSLKMIEKVHLNFYTEFQVHENNNKRIIIINLNNKPTNSTFL